MKNKNNYLLYFILICLVLGIYIFFSNDNASSSNYVQVTTGPPYTTSGIINANVRFQKEEDKKLVQQLLNTL